MEHLYDANKWSLWEKQLLQMISCGREIDGQDVDCRRDGLAGRRILPVGTSRCLPLPCHHCRPDGAGGGTYCQTANHSLSSVDAGNAHCNQPPPYHVSVGGKYPYLLLDLAIASYCTDVLHFVKRAGF